MKNRSVCVSGFPSGLSSQREKPIESSGWKYSTCTASPVRSTVTSARFAALALRNHPECTNAVWGTSMKFSARSVTSPSKAVSIMYDRHPGSPARGKRYGAGEPAASSGSPMYTHTRPSCSTVGNRSRRRATRGVAPGPSDGTVTHAPLAS
jgi:hypothetical protein